MFLKRIAKMRAALRGKKLSALLVCKPENVRYLCNYVGTNGRLLITPKKATLITDFRYLRAARKQLPKTVAIFDQKDGIKKLLSGFKTLGFEQDFVPHLQFLSLQKALPKTALKHASGLVEDLRILKDAEEIKTMKKAVNIANRAFLKLKKTVRAGVSEDELEWNLLTFARELGADGFSFPPIICFGKNTADVHHQKEPNRLKKGESVLVDMGIVYRGYATDMTRTFYPWGASKKEREIYDLVLRANTQAIAAIKVGKTTGDIDRVARAVIEKAGYGDFFGHGTGHGVGLEVHEAPSVSKSATTKIRPGMVFTVEPGIYLDDVGGVRIEDMVYINEKGGVEVLTTPSKEL